MTTLDLNTALLDDGLQSTHYFNGRLVSAEDLTRDQRENDRAHQRLGRCAGKGVAHGLWVSTSAVSTTTAPAVTVKAGMALNGCGQTLWLPHDVDVQLLRTATAPAGGTGGFGACAPPRTGAYVASTGVYLLSIAPASGSVGRAPASGLSSVTAPCNVKTDVIGVQFVIRSVTIDSTILADENRLRNRVAHGFLGTADPRRARFMMDPFGAAEEPYGWLADPTVVQTTDAEVPLAAIHWASSGIRFVDPWSVRRELTRPAAGDRWRSVTAERLRAEGEACFLQFQDQLFALVLELSNASTFKVGDRFDYLPAAGLLGADETGSSRQFSTRQFFSGMQTRGPLHVSVRELEGLLDESFLYPPIEVGSGEFVWIYEGAESALFGQSSDPTRSRPWRLFVSGHVQRRGTARFDLARWDRSEYGLL